MQPIRTRGRRRPAPASAAPSASGRCGGAAGAGSRGGSGCHEGREDQSSRPILAERDLHLGLPRRLGPGGGRQRTVEDFHAGPTGVLHARRRRPDDGRQETRMAAGGELRLLLPVDPSTGAAPGASPSPATSRAAQSAVRDAYVGGVAALAQGVPARGPARLGPPAGLAARPAPAHRPDLAPQQGPVRAAQGRARRALLPAGRPAPGAAARRPRRARPGDAARELGVTRDVAEQNLAGRHRSRLAAAARRDPGTAHVRVVALDALLERRLAAPRPDRPPGRPQAPPVHALVGTAVAAVVALGVGRAGLPAERQRRRRAPAGEARGPGATAKLARRRDPDRRATSSTATRSAGSGRTGRGGSPAPTTTPPATASTPPASRPGSPTPTASPRSCGPSRPAAGRTRSAVQTVEVSQSVAAGPSGLPHHGRLVRRLPRRPAPGARAPTASTTSATRPTC